MASPHLPSLLPATLTFSDQLALFRDAGLPMVTVLAKLPQISFFVLPKTIIRHLNLEKWIDR